MKLFYFESKCGNFGDDLNPWLWPKVLGDFESNESAEWLYGIGTILNMEINQRSGKKLILGSGYRPVKDHNIWAPENVEYIFVRGVLTAEIVGDKSLAISDPALLVSNYFKRNVSKGETVGFMPHYKTANDFDCEAIARDAGCVFIDPRNSVEQVMSEVLTLDRLIAEAMHGAIVADALGIPWVRLITYSEKRESPLVSDFKWADWASTLSLDHKAAAVSYLPYPGRSVARRLVKNLYVKWRCKVLTSCLRELKDCTSFQVSKLSKREELVERMQEKIQTSRLLQPTSHTLVKEADSPEKETDPFLSCV